jgi:O-antigen/teichoic acid export membrane protein
MSNIDKSMKTILKGSILVIFGVFLSKLFGYFFRLVVSRTGPTEYGLLSLGMAISGFIVTIALVGMNYGVVRYVAYYLGKKDPARIKGTITSALRITVPISLILGALLFFFADFISLKIFNEPDLGIILKVFAFIIPLDVTKRIILIAIRAFQKLKYEVYSRDLIEGSFKVILGVILVSLGYKAFGAAIAYLLALLFALIAAFYFLEKKVFPIFKTKIQSIKNYKDLLEYSWPMMFSEVLNLLLLWTDTFMLGFFSVAALVGIYNAAVPTAQLMFLIPLSIATLFFPVFIELYSKGEKANFEKSFKITNKWVYMVNLLALAMFILFPKIILTILFPDNYVDGYLVLVILAIAYFISSLAMTSKLVLATMKKTRFIFSVVLIGAILNIILNIILIPKYSILGASIATAISTILVAILFNVYSYKVTKINPFSKDYSKIFISIAIPTLLLYLFNYKYKVVTSLLSLIAVFLIVFMVYVSMLLITKSLQKEDKMAILSIKEELIKKISP